MHTTGELALKNSFPREKKAIWCEETAPRESKHKNNIKAFASSLGDLDQLLYLSERNIHAPEGWLGGFDLMGKSLTRVPGPWLVSQTATLMARHMRELMGEGSDVSQAEKETPSRNCQGARSDEQRLAYEITTHIVGEFQEHLKIKHIGVGSQG